MEVTEQMLAELNQTYAGLEKEYEDIHFREEVYRVAMTLVNHTISEIDIPGHSLREIIYETTWAGVSSTMRDVPDSIIAAGIISEDTVDGYRAMFRDVYAGKPVGGCTVNVRDSHGVWSWMKITYKTLFDKDNKPQRAICYSENITQKREAESLFDQFVSIVARRADYLQQVNLTQDIVTKVTQKSAGETGTEAGMTYTHINEYAVQCALPQYHEELNQKLERMALLQQFYDGVREIVVQYEYVWPGSTVPEWLESHMYLLMNTDEDVCGILATRSIEAEKRTESERDSLAEYDQLCPVYKRDTFEAHVQREMAAGNPMALFMVDVDKFKTVNDRYGHAFGDEVLKKVAEIIKNNFRKSDYVARFGGDEFCALMCGNYNAVVLKSSAELMLERVRQLKFENGYQASISVGVARWNKTDDLKTLTEKADKALYESKKVRDTVTL